MKQLYFIISILTLNIGFPAKIYDQYMDYYPKVKKELLNRGHTLVNSLDKCDLIPCWHNPFLKKKYRHKAILYTFEPPIFWSDMNNEQYLSSFLKVCTWRHDLCEENPAKFKKFFYPQYKRIRHQQIKSFHERKFACIINSFINSNHPKELYSKRKQIAMFYNKHFPTSLSVYGRRGWTDLNLKVYKGKTNDKRSTLRDYKFSYCYENYDNDHHYITEKILHCISNLCVPIYLGSSNITDYIPEDVFIDARKFNSIKEIHNFISNIDEETWNSYLDAMKRFDQSKESKIFSPSSHLDSIIKNTFEALEELGLN